VVFQHSGVFFSCKQLFKCKKEQHSLEIIPNSPSHFGGHHEALPFIYFSPHNGGRIGHQPSYVCRGRRTYST
jgi:hypothetical protein